MRRMLIHVILGCTSCFYTNVGAQQSPASITTVELDSIVHKLLDSLAYYYVNEQEGLRIGKHIAEQHESGKYNDIDAPKELAQRLTEDLRSIGGDLHLFVTYTGKSKSQTSLESNNVPINKGYQSNYGFSEIKYFDDGIAYLKIDHFSNWNHANGARQKAIEIMQLLGNSQSLIIDVRDNRGGVPYVASCLISYLFEKEPLHLADYFTRFNNYTYGIFTEPLVPGRTFPDIPVFVLVNKKSASAAEELAFWLQNQERATIIGESTAGAGYGALNHSLNDRFTISISSEEEIDPITGLGFQKTGVVPDVPVSADSAFMVSMRLAKSTIKKLEGKRKKLELDHWFTFKKQLHSQLIIADDEISAELISFYKRQIISYDSIEVLGTELKSYPLISISVLKVNTLLYPFYPGPFDAYAKALAENDQYDLALNNYNKAVQLAQLKQNPGLATFVKNRADFIRNYKN